MRSLLLAGVGLGLLGGGVQSSTTPAKGNLGGAIDGITAEERAAYNAGRPFFLRTWIPEGETTSNSNSCLSCHRLPVAGGVSYSPVNHVFFVPDKNDPSGFAGHSWRIVKDGQVIGQNLPQGDVHSRRPQPMFGLGLLEAVDDATILALADPEDKNKDGISGRALMVDGRVGKFGWKGHVPTLYEFNKTAFRVELGLVTGNGRGGNALTEEKIQAVTAMSQLMAPPPVIREHIEGKSLFLSIGCGGCHTPKMTTGDKAAFPSLNRREFEAYSDLLLHDLGPGPAKITKSGNAARGEFRTAPLWGLGTIGGPYFHDGSSETLEEAILRHEGEAMGVTKKYKALPRADKDKVLHFLKGL
jgi:CxxC motif-containing protein (DUF1111 family)